MILQKIREIEFRLFSKLHKKWFHEIISKFISMGFSQKLRETNVNFASQKVIYNLRKNARCLEGLISRKIANH